MPRKKSVTFDSPTWQYVLSFAHEMEGKLTLNRHKGDRAGWLAMSPEQLIQRLRDEIIELETAIQSMESSTVIQKECADIGNFAMMLHDWFAGKGPGGITK